MKKISYYIICALLGVFILSCEDQWDKHIESNVDDKVVSDLSMLAYMKENSEYTEFVTLLERVGVDSLFQKGMQHTLWVPTAESLEHVTGLNDSLARRFVMNHINLNSTYASIFKPEMSVDLMSGKRVKMHLDTEFSTGFRLENAGVKKSNLICKDGVIHELDTCLVPALNLYEKLENDQKYSALLELLKRYEQNVFKPELSTQIGVDDWGNLIYDSVFVLENLILTDGDIRVENQLFTVFATPNDELLPRLEQLYTDFKLINGTEPKRSDSLELEEWVVKSLIYDEVIRDYGVKENLYSVHENLWKCSKQSVHLKYSECSNGLFYEVEQLHFPTVLLMKEMRNNVNDMVVKFTSNSTMHEYFKHEITNKGTSGSGITAIAKKVSGIDVCQYRGKAGKKGGKTIYDFDFDVYWDSFRKVQRPSTGAFDSLAIASIMPGEYLVKGSYSKVTSYCHEDMIVYINGQEVGQIVGIKGLENGSFDDFTLGTVTIDESVGVAPVEFRFRAVAVATNRDQRMISPFHIELIPTENNY